MEHLCLLLTAAVAEAKFYCAKTRMPLELGVWKHDLEHMDSAVVENKPVMIYEGQVYVYENYFPGRIIRYINVDNLAKTSCGASAVLQRGGLGTSSAVIVLHADSHNEIRSVIDIWGTRSQLQRRPHSFTNMTSLYLLQEKRPIHKFN